MARHHLQSGPAFLFGAFPHYAANGREANEGRWHDERVDLTTIYRELSGDPTGAHVVDVALFCESDQTGDSTVAYFADVRVLQGRRRAQPPGSD